MDTINDEAKKNYRFNVAVSWTDGVLFSIGLAFCTDLTILPVFLSNFTDSKMIISLIPAITMLGITLPPLLSAHWVESLPRKKPAAMWFGAAMRLPWLFLAAFTYWFTNDRGPMGVTVFLGLYALFTIAWGLIIPPWLDIIGKIIPLRRRGFFMGVRFAAGRLAGTAAGFAAYILIEKVSFPNNFAILFLLSFVFMSVSLGFFGMTKEPPHSGIKTKRSFTEFMKAIPATIRNDENFRWFTVFNILVSAANLALGLYAVHGIERFNQPDSISGIFTAVLMFSQTLAYLVWGYWGDRRGYKGSLVLSTLMCVLTPLVALFAPSVQWYYLVFVLAGGFISANQIVNMNIMLEFCSPEDRPLYIGASYAFTAPVFSLSPLIGGAIADFLSWDALFVAALIFPALALAVLILKVQDPRHAIPVTSNAGSAGD